MWNPGEAVGILVGVVAIDGEAMWMGVLGIKPGIGTNGAANFYTILAMNKAWQRREMRKW